MRRCYAAVWALVAIASILLSGCASAPKLNGGERIAIVSYSLLKSITQTGEPYELGPMLPSQQEEFYRYHQQSIDRAWEAFKALAPTIFGSRQLLDFAAIEGSEELKAASAAAPRKTLGVDISAAGQRVHPAGLNYVSLRDEAQNAEIAGILKADILVAFDFRAEYEASSGMSIGALSATRADMRLAALVTVADAKGKVLRRSSVGGVSKETALIGTLGGMTFNLPHEEYPRLILSAQEELFRNLKKQVDEW